MAGGRRDEGRAQGRVSCPWEGALGEQLFVGERLRQGHDLLMGFDKQVQGLIVGGVIMLVPQLHIHLAVITPVVAVGKKVVGPALLVVLHPVQQQLMPLVEMDEHVLDVPVACPMGPLLLAQVEGKAAIAFFRCQRLKQRHEFVEAIISRLDEFFLGGRSYYDCPPYYFSCI